MNKNKIFPALICGFGISVISFIPLISLLHCCRLTSVLGGYFAVFLYNKAMENDFEFKLSIKDSILLGLLTAIIATVFLTLFQTIMIAVSSGNQITEAITLMEKFFQGVQIPDFIYSIEKDITTYGFSTILTLMFFISEFIFNSIFCIVGSLIFYSVNKNKTQKL